MSTPQLLAARIRAALVGTAVGDALGDPTEFVRSDAELEQRWGSRGIRALEGDPPQFTDDTQMTLFTAESLLVAALEDDADLDDPGSADLLVRRALEAQLRWRATQKRSALAQYGIEPAQGSLRADERMHRVKSPGATCLGALDQQHGRFDARAPVQFATNDSKGCGGVMRSAPYGLVMADPWSVACLAARLTHAHPLGWSSAGTYAVLVRDLLVREDDHDIVSVFRGAISPLATRSLEAEEIDHLAVLLERAVDDAAERRPIQGEDVARQLPAFLGEGWIAEEALAIGMWCALAFEDPIDALAASATHVGDTDSTAAITGCLLGLIHGDEAIFSPLDPSRIEALDLVHSMADRLVALRSHEPHADAHPVARTWWIESGRVLGGMFAAGKTPTESEDRLGALLDAGVRLFVNLQEPRELGHGRRPFDDYEPLLRKLARERGITKLAVIRSPIPDMGVPEDIGELRRAIDTVDHLTRNGDLAYVHCWGGHGRTGLFAGCLLRRRGLSADEAFERISRAREHDAHLASYPSPQTEAQRDVVRLWHEQRGSVPAPEREVDDGKAAYSPAWVDDAPVFEIGTRLEDGIHRRALRVMRMLQRLHTAGYQHLRAFMFMSPSGMNWRCWIAPRNAFQADGWRIRDEVDWQDPTQVATYTSGMDNQYFGWEDAATDSADALARKFVERFPELARAGQGLDFEYAGWFALVVGSVTDEDAFPIFMADWAGPYDSQVPAPPPLAP